MVKRRALLAGAGVVGAVALVASLSHRSGRKRRHRRHGSCRSGRRRVRAGHQGAEGAERKAIKAKYGGKKITSSATSVGRSQSRRDLVAKFTKDTGIKVKLVPHPAASDASYSQLVRTFSPKSSAIDVTMIDVVWPGAFAPYLVNLKPELGKQSSSTPEHRPERHDRRKARRHAVVR